MYRVYCYDVLGVRTRRRLCLNEYNKTINILNICPGPNTQSISCKGTFPMDKKPVQSQQITSEQRSSERCSDVILLTLNRFLPTGLVYTGIFSLQLTLAID